MTVWLRGCGHSAGRSSAYTAGSLSRLCGDYAEFRHVGKLDSFGNIEDVLDDQNNGLDTIPEAQKRRRLSQTGTITSIREVPY